MVLDINIFRKDKGGNPDLVKESQQRRFASVDLVQEVIDADTVAKKCMSFIYYCSPHASIIKNQRKNTFLYS